MNLKENYTFVKPYFKRGGEMLNVKKKYVAIGAVICLVLMAAGYYLCGRSGVSDNSVRIESAREQFEQAEDRQREITDGIEAAEERTEAIQGRIDQSQERIESAENRTDSLETNLSDADRIIAECQQILRNIRSRGEEKAEGN